MNSIIQNAIGSLKVRARPEAQAVITAIDALRESENFLRLDDPANCLACLNTAEAALAKVETVDAAAEETFPALSEPAALLGENPDAHHRLSQGTARVGRPGTASGSGQVCDCRLCRLRSDHIHCSWYSILAVRRQNFLGQKRRSTGYIIREDSLNPSRVMLL